MASLTARRTSRLPFQAITIRAPIRASAQPSGTSRTGVPLTSRRCSADHVFGRSSGAGRAATIRSLLAP